MQELSGECLRRFERLEREVGEKEARIRSLEKFNVAVVTIVGAANFVWIYFIAPALER